MKRIALIVPILCIALVPCWGVLGQCVSPPRAKTGQFEKRLMGGNYHWREVPGDVGQMWLYRGAQHVGTYIYRTGFYHPKTQFGHGEPTKAPISPLEYSPLAKKHRYAFGVPSYRLVMGNTFAIDGHACNYDDAWKSIADNLRDDAKAPHLTIISKNIADTRRTVEAWEKKRQLEPNVGKARVQLYDAANPVSQLLLAPFRLDIDAGFQRSGNMIIAQGPATEPEGKSKVRAWYDPPTEGLLDEALRIVDPIYKPGLPSLPNLPSLPAGAELVWVLLAVGVLGVIVLVAAKVH